MNESDLDARISTATTTVVALAAASESLVEDAASVATGTADAVARGYFVPSESDALRAWFTRYLTVRAALHETLADLRPVALRRVRARRTSEIRALAAGFTAACLLVRLGRVLIWEVAAHDLVRRKLDEPAEEHRVPAGMFAAIYAALLDVRTEAALVEGRDALRAQREEMRRVVDEKIVALCDAVSAALEIEPGDIYRARRTHRKFRWFRIGRSVASAALFLLAERSGRIIADLRWPWRRHRVGRGVRRRLVAMLQPGDVLVTRHAHALSNLFLPGYWPHASLYLGSRASVEAMGVPIRPRCAERWGARDEVLEARKDGVRLRPLTDTLGVDSVLILRPLIDPGELPRAFEQALRHEGKPYNFDFDFFTDDRLVCTEVVYRAYQGVGGMDIPLSSRFGRPTLSAEDLVSLGLAGSCFRIVAVYGVPGAYWRIASGDHAAALARPRR